MRSFALATLTWSLCLAACGGAVESPDTRATPPDTRATPPDTGSPVSTGGTPARGDASLPHAIDASIARIHIDHVYLMAPPDCRLPYRPVDYDRATHMMSWAECSHEVDWGNPDAGTVLDAPASSRVLTASEAQAVERVLATITYVENPRSGGEDGEEFYLLTYDAAGQLVRKYSRRNINDYGFPAAEKISDIYDLLTKLNG